jgi:hypothetical protein
MQFCHPGGRVCAWHTVGDRESGNVAMHAVSAAGFQNYKHALLTRIKPSMLDPAVMLTALL